MADLGKNSLWKKMSTKSSDAVTEMIGPDYSYADNIQSASSLGVGSDGSFGQLGTNVDAVAYYVGALITGNPPLGDQFYVNTGGTCVAPDGQSRERFNYINNMSSGSAALPSAISDLGSDFNGLIPGVVDDIEGLNPLYIFTAMTSSGTPQCGCYYCPVTSGSPHQWLTPELSPDFSTDICTAVDSSYCPGPAKESFTNMHSNDMVGAIPTIVAALSIALLVFSGKS